MTNGEKLQSIFPNMEWEVKDNTVLTDVDNGSWFSLDWWNAEYKEPTKALEQEPKSEWEQDHAILKAYSDGANEVLDKIRAEINTMPFAVTSMEEIYVNRDKIINIIDKYKAESEG